MKGWDLETDCAAPMVRDMQVLNGFFKIGRQALMMPRLASIRVQIPRGMKLYVTSAWFANELCTTVVRMTPAMSTLCRIRM